MVVRFDSFAKKQAINNKDFDEVQALACQLRDYLNEIDVIEKIKVVHKLNAKSQQIQGIFLNKLEELGFQSEKRGLFSGGNAAGLRPDYFCPIGDTGVILEVERGKTIANNMDLLDVWKCHICDYADYLFLIVPQERQRQSGTSQNIYTSVKNRVSTFFQEGKYINIEAVYLFGY